MVLLLTPVDATCAHQQLRSYYSVHCKPMLLNEVRRPGVTCWTNPTLRPHIYTKHTYTQVCTRTIGDGCGGVERKVYQPLVFAQPEIADERPLAQQRAFVCCLLVSSPR